jgi:hypothetical protein
MKTGVSNVLFKECKKPMTNGLMRFLIKSSAGIQFTSKMSVYTLELRIKTSRHD